jgi:putative PIN family toxin of toxin-antitoxin system
MKRRWVFDTNVLISAALSKRSTPRKALDNARSNGMLLQSTFTFDELVTALSRQKFERYLSDSGRNEFLNLIFGMSFFLKTSTTLSICRDPKDNKFLELAIDGYADAIVTGDEDLLVLHPFEGIAILTPAQFLDQAD